MNTRQFSGGVNQAPARDVEGAPDQMRVEFVDVSICWRHLGQGSTMLFCGWFKRSEIIASTIQGWRQCSVCRLRDGLGSDQQQTVGACASGSHRR